MKRHGEWDRARPCLGDRALRSRGKPRRRTSSSASAARSPAAAPRSGRSSRTAPSRRSPTSTRRAAFSARSSPPKLGDDRADPKEGVSVANKFAGDGVKFVIGHFNSGVTIPASDVYQENGMLEITPASTNPKVTDRGLWNIFRTCGRDDQQGSVAGDYILKNFKGKKIAIIHDKTTYGQGLADVTRGVINKGGIKEVLYEGVNKDDKDFSARRLQGEGVRRRPDLLGRPARHRRPDPAPDARPGHQGAADGRRRHRRRRVRGDRRPGRRRHADDLRPRSAQAAGSEGRRREIPRQEFRAAGLHALQLRRRADHQAGRGSGELARPEEGRREDALGHEVLDRDRRHLLSTRRATSPGSITWSMSGRRIPTARSPTWRSSSASANPKMRQLCDESPGLQRICIT